jgi:di/tricarboxylate transporter
MQMNKQSVVGIGAIVTLLATGTGLDPEVIAKAFAGVTWPQAAIAIAFMVFLYLKDSPATKAKIKELRTAVERASVPPGAKP